jgi:hypothetical protein
MTHDLPKGAASIRPDHLALVRRHVQRRFGVEMKGEVLKRKCHPDDLLKIKGCSQTLFNLTQVLRR